MAKREILVGSTDQTIDVFIQDSSSTVGAGLTGLVFNTASLTCYYRKGATGTPTALTLATQTVGGAHSDGGFVAVDGTNCPGQYRLDLSDTIVASAGMVTLYLRGATNMAPCVAEIEVVAINKFDATRAGMTALPNAAAEASGGLYTRGTGAGQINQDANGRIDVKVVNNANDVITAASIQTAAITAAKFAAGAIDAAAIADGAIDASAIADGAIDAATFATSAITAASIATGAITSAKFAAGAIDAAAIAPDAIGASELAADAVAEIQSGLATAANLATVAGYLDTEIAAILAVTVKLDTTLVLDGAVYQFTANALELAPTGGSAPTVGQIADAVWDEARAGHVAAGSFGEALDATISSRSTLVAADVRTAVGLASANLDTQLAAVQTDTNDIQTRLPAALIGGRMVANLEAIDNLTTAGNNATLNLKKLNVVNDAGDAFVASSTGGNGSGVAASGHGTGSGVKGTGGTTGHGVYGIGGATSGNGVLGAAAGGNSNGVRGTGFGSGSGVHGEGGDTGNGIRGVGGAVSGAGIHGRGVLGNSPGMELVGQGSAAGLLSTGGATGPGQRLVGGATSGTALELAITAGSVYVTTAAVTASFEAVAITAPTGPAANFREMVVQLWRRFFKKATLSSTELKTYADNGSTVVTTQAVTDAAGLQTEEAAV